MAADQKFDRAGAMVALGEFIRQRRRELGLTQTELGTRIGYYQERISALERGGYGIPSLHSMHELAAALEVPVARLLAAAGCLTQDSAKPGSDQSRQAAAHLQEKNKQVAGKYEIVCERMYRAQALAAQMEDLRIQLSSRRRHLRELTECCVQQAES